MMQRKPMKPGKGFKRKTIERKPTVHTPVPEHLRRRVGPFTGLVAAAKTEAQRNRALLDMAEGRDCLVQAPAGILCTGRDTTVACHSNQASHGKAGARKADDHWSAWGCYACHVWLDQSAACAELKADVFAEAMQRQLDAWRVVASNPAEPERLRQAARWALMRHAAA